MSLRSAWRGRRDDERPHLLVLRRWRMDSHHLPADAAPGGCVPMKELHPLQFCRICIRASEFVVTMRHGAEYPACAEHIANVLRQAYDHDGDHGRVTVHQVGVSTEITWQGIKA